MTPIRPINPALLILMLMLMESCLAENLKCYQCMGKKECAGKPKETECPPPDPPPPPNSTATVKVPACMVKIEEGTVTMKKCDFNDDDTDNCRDVMNQSPTNRNKEGKPEKEMVSLCDCSGPLCNSDENVKKIQKKSKNAIKSEKKSSGKDGVYSNSHRNVGIMMIILARL